MGVCPICNGFNQVTVSCPSCGDLLEDNGKTMDYFDDYSPYMPIDQMKLENGYMHDYEKEQCLHLISCSQCGHQQLKFIKEI